MRDPSVGTNPAKIIIVVVALVLLGVLGYFGWNRLIQWHEDEVHTAVERERQKVEEQYKDTRIELLEKQKEIEERKRKSAVSQKRLEDVFGEPVFKKEDGSCSRLEQQIRSFFDYLETNRGIGSDEKSAYEIFADMVDDLAETPPLVSGETRNLSNLLKNRAHFFRILGKDRIKLVIAVLRSDEDVLEHAMHNIYKYFVLEKCCEDYFGSCIPEENLYEYAAFFLDTLSGQSYLMRRDAPVRTLIRYYSVLMLDRAIEQGINRYGIDIRPRIETVADEINARNDLHFQKRYIDGLDSLREKYGEPSAD